VYCPYCRNKQTDVFKTLSRRSKTYRYRRCQFCKARFRTMEKAVRWQGVDRNWPGTAPNRKGWQKNRQSALKNNCEVPTCGVDFKKPGVRRHVDHIVPARLIRKLRLGCPDRRENLQSICGTCHGYKLEADHKLCLGDRLGYFEILREHSFDLDRAERALKLYGI
jgi:HNH endonuclease